MRDRHLGRSRGDDGYRRLTMFGVLVGPFLLAFAGEWFGGEADPGDIRQAIAWGYAPFAVAGLCWIPLALWYKGRISAPGTEIPLILCR